MKITGLQTIPIYSTREMGRPSPSGPDNVVSYHVIVLLETDAGITGLGEMSDVDFAQDREAVAKIQGRLEPLLVGRSPFDLTAIQVDLGREEAPVQVACGIDIALHDAVGKALGVPVYQLLGGKYRNRIRFSYPLSNCVVEPDIEANLQRVERLLNEGHSTIRYYFGIDLDLDERFLRELRRRWGDAVEINALDASGRFDVPTAIEVIGRMAEFEPNLVESPVKGRHFAPAEDFLAVRQAVEVPIGEHVPGADVAAKLARADAVDVWNVGTGWLGMTSCRKMFGLAELFDIKVLHGSTVELSIGTAARAHLLASVPNMDYPCYLAGPLVYQEQVVKEKVRYEEGYLYPPDGPGLGVELDEDLLNAQRL